MGNLDEKAKWDGHAFSLQPIELLRQARLSLAASRRPNFLVLKVQCMNGNQGPLKAKEQVSNDNGTPVLQDLTQ